MAPLSPGAARGGRDRARLPLVVALLALFAALQVPGVFAVPFINDDYVFLDRTREASFASLWSRDQPIFGWYRPWSRELHYWALQRLFGADAAAFHAVSLALWLAVMAAYHVLARRVAGAAAAATATAGLAAMAAWGVPLLWVAAVQELWMLLFCLLALLALGRWRGLASAGLFALALLSKETAAALPAIALAHARWGLALPWRAALARLAPHAVVLLAWAAVHPLLGGRLAAGPPPASEAIPTPPAAAAARTAAALVSLDPLPAPEHPARFAAKGATAALALAAVVAVGFPRRSPGGASSPRSAAREGPPDPRALVALGLAWALAGWLPVLAPRIAWHAYYTLLGAMGAWLVLGHLLARARAAAVAAAAALGFLRAAAAETPSTDWGAEWYQRRAAAFLGFMRDDLTRLRPRLPPHARLFFTGIPSQVGFLTAGGPALRVWYGDPTLGGGYYRDYRARPPGRPGPDLFFRYDSTRGFVEIEAGAGGASRAENPRWEADQRELAAALARAEDWPAAAAAFERLARARPDRAEDALSAAVSYESAGDSARAGRWYREALAAPGLDSADRRFARDFERRLRAGRQPITR